MCGLKSNVHSLETYVNAVTIVNHTYVAYTNQIWPSSTLLLLKTCHLRLRTFLLAYNYVAFTTALTRHTVLKVSITTCVQISRYSFFYTNLTFVEPPPQPRLSMSAFPHKMDFIKEKISSMRYQAESSQCWGMVMCTQSWASPSIDLGTFIIKRKETF